MQVINLKSVRGRKGIIVCDRTSSLGNPFALKDEDSRTQVIAGFRRYLWRVLQGDEPAIAAQSIATQLALVIADSWQRPTRQQSIEAFNSLKPDSRLGCWCAPLSCHCEQLVRAWIWLHPEQAELEGIRGCQFCQRLGTKLCDGRFDLTSLKTCDRPLCADCAYQSGVLLICGRKKGQSFSDSIDLCPKCKSLRNQNRESNEIHNPIF